MGSFSAPLSNVATLGLMGFFGYLAYAKWVGAAPESPVPGMSATHYESHCATVPEENYRADCRGKPIRWEGTIHRVDGARAIEFVPLGERRIFDVALTRDLPVIAERDTPRASRREYAGERVVVTGRLASRSGYAHDITEGRIERLPPPAEVAANAARRAEDDRRRAEEARARRQEELAREPCFNPQFLSAADVRAAGEGWTGAFRHTGAAMREDAHRIAAKHRELRDMGKPECGWWTRR